MFSCSRCLCCRQGGSPQSLDISVLPWIWFNGMTHLIQVTDSSKGDDSNEEYIRPQSYFYPDKSWQEETDKRERMRHACVRGMCTLTHTCNAILYITVITSTSPPPPRENTLCLQTAFNSLKSECLERKWKQLELIYDSCNRKGHQLYWTIGEYLL